MRESLVMAVLVLVGCASPPERASMTIHAVAATGDTWYVPPQPIWRFAITNTGNCEVVWESSVDVRDRDDQDYSHAGGHIDWPDGVLLPGQGVFANMIVPAKAGKVWRASVTFWPVSAQDVKRYESEAERFPLPVGHVLPCPEGSERRYNDEWHH